MDVREKLVGLIFKSLCRHIHKSCKLAENIADDLITDGVTVHEWISVKDRLPEPTNFVVVLTTGGDRIIARLDKYGWLRYGGYETERLRPITHWMPLPEPPKGE